MIVTIGNQLVSKKLRQHFRKNKPLYHWDIDPYDEYGNNNYFVMDREDFPFITESEALECLLEAEEKTDSDFSFLWHNLSAKSNELKGEYLKSIPFSDLKVMEAVVASLPEHANVQYGNSTPVRYSNFFEHKSSITVNANRGTSGIDGCVSTAAGAAWVNNKPTVCVVGDVSFFYDSNSLWNNYLSPNFRIIVINNSGGNIFRLIEGPGKVKDFEMFFETQHHLNASHLASMYNIPYYFSDRLETLEEILPSFYAPQNGRPAILEIKTNNETSAAVYKQYFEYLRNNR
jgi:2-succinyl-5-enolpyruvyl-6-hydroxy-3-cyclohexene-1-carboxylate synthase